MIVWKNVGTTEMFLFTYRAIAMTIASTKSVSMTVLVIGKLPIVNSVSGASVAVINRKKPVPTGMYILICISLEVKKESVNLCNRIDENSRFIVFCIDFSI